MIFRPQQGTISTPGAARLTRGYKAVGYVRHARGPRREKRTFTTIKRDFEINSFTGW